MSTNFDVVLRRMGAAGIKANTNSAREWLRKKIKSLGVSRDKLLTDKNRAANTPQIGRMYFFAYNPKYKEKLPYYDEFPLIFVVERYNNGFLGINLHYVSPRNRIAIMDALTKIANNKKYDSTTKLAMSYKTLQSVSKYSMIKPCIKRYLYSHVKSRFAMIDANEWDIGIFLPVQKFRKAAPSMVWSDSARK
jgi:hypothetical protein